MASQGIYPCTNPCNQFPKWPELKFKNECEYWDQFDYDSPYPIPVRLRKGKLNFYQVDFKPIYEDMNKWNPGGHIDCKSKAKKAKLKNND